MEPEELALVRTNAPGNDICYKVCPVLDETPEGWILVGMGIVTGVGSDRDTTGVWFSPENVLKRWMDKSHKGEKFNHNAIPIGTLAVRTSFGYFPRQALASPEKSKKFIGIIVEKKGAVYVMMQGDKIWHADWQSVRPFDPAIDGE